MCWVMPPARRDDLRFADRVQERGLAVVDVPMIVTTAAFDEVAFVVLELGLHVDIVGGVHDLDFLSNSSASTWIASSDRVCVRSHLPRTSAS